MNKVKFSIVHTALLSLISIILVFSGCSPAYIPNVINTPLLGNQGELQLDIHTGLAGIDPQGAYAITDNIGLMLNGSFANRTSDSSNSFHKHNFGELGVGYFTKFYDNGRLEVFTGLGYGDLRAKFESELFNSSANVLTRRFFIQPAIGAKTNIFDGSFATRFVFLDIYQGNKSIQAVLFEPAITAKVGYKYAKAVFQFGLSLPLSATENYYYQPFLFSIGLQGFIGLLTKNDRKF